MKISENIKNWLVIILIVIGILYIYKTFIDMPKPSNTNVAALVDSVRILTDENGKLRAQVQTITLSNYKELTELTGVKDSLIKKLQEEIKKNKGGSAIVLNTITKIHDTLYVNKSNFKFDNEHVLLSGSISPKPYFDLEVRNNPTLSLFKEDNKVIAQYKDTNPYTKVNDMRAYMDLPKDKDNSQGLGAGIHYDLISKEPGIGIGYYKIILPFKLF